MNQDNATIERLTKELSELSETLAQCKSQLEEAVAFNDLLTEVILENNLSCKVIEKKKEVEYVKKIELIRNQLNGAETLDEKIQLITA